jgi:hypothetical protein
MMNNKVNLYREVGPLLEQLGRLTRQEGEAVYQLGIDLYFLQFDMYDEIARVLWEVHNVLTDLGENAEDFNDRIFVEKVNYVRSLLTEKNEDESK